MSSEAIKFVNGSGVTRRVATANPLPVTAVGGSGAATIADGADVTQGAKADAAATTDTGTFSLIALVKRLLTKFTGPATSVQTQVTGIASTVTILAANTGRKGAVFSNDAASGILYLRFNGSAATVSNYTVALQPGASFTLGAEDYTGEVRGIWSAATGFVNVTEFTA